MNSIKHSDVTTLDGGTVEDQFKTYGRLMVSKTHATDRVILFDRLKKLNLGTAVIEECLRSFERQENVQGDSTQRFKKDILSDKLANCVAEQLKITQSINDIKEKIEFNINSRTASDLPTPTVEDWKKFKSETKLKINNLWIKLKTKRKRKIKHLMDKYPKSNNKKHPKNKIIKSKGGNSKNVLELQIKNLVDAENFKQKVITIDLLEDEPNDLFINDDEPAKNFSSKDVTNITKNKTLEEVKFFTNDVEIILSECKHLHNYKATNDLLKCCTQMIDKMEELNDDDLSADKIMNKKYYTVSLKKCINILNEVINLNQDLIDKKIDKYKCNICKKSVSIRTLQYTSECNDVPRDILEEIKKQVKDIESANRFIINLENMISKCMSKHNIQEVKMIDIACDTLEDMIDMLPSSDGRKEMINKVIKLKSINESVTINIQTAMKDLKSVKCDMCGTDIEPKLNLNNILEQTQSIDNIMLLDNLVTTLEKYVNECSHKHNKKDMRILKETCERLQDKLMYEYNDNEPIIKAKLKCIQDNVEAVTEIIENPDSSTNTCIICNKKIRFQMNNYKMEEFLDWTAILENIKYLDKDLENVQLEELMIEEGIQVSENVLSLKTLAPGYRTYRKITKDEVMIDIEKTKCMVRRGEENKRRNEKDEQEKRVKDNSMEDLRILHGLDNDWKLNYNEDPENRVPFIKEVCHMNLNYLKATDLKTRATTSWPNAASNEIELEMMILSRQIEKKVDEMIEKHKTQKINIEHTNLTQQNIEGLKELNERKDLRIVLTDKSKKLLILTNETYKKMIEVYTVNAKPVNDEELRNRESLNNGHVRSLMRIFRIGCDNNYDQFSSENSSKIQAIKEALISSNQAGAKLDVYGKDHKKPNTDGTYKTRPLSNCIGSISESLGGLLVIILDNTKDSDPEHIKRSTEEMLEHIMRMNKLMNKSNNEIIEAIQNYVISMDVTALFVEIRPDRAGEEIYDSILNNEWTFEADATEMSYYISVNWSREKINKHGLGDIIPVRTKLGEANHNSQITMKSDEMNRNVNKPSDGKWTFIKKLVDAETKKKLVAATLAIAVEGCLTNHIFQYGDQFYLQPYSGVIGLDLMRAVAELYMSRWLKKYMRKLEDLSEQPVPIINKVAEDSVDKIMEIVLEKVEKEVTVTEIINDILEKVENVNNPKIESIAWRTIELVNNGANTTKKFKCEHCNKLYVRKNALLKHKSIMHKKVNFPCKQCDSSFKHKIELIRHREKDHEENVSENENKISIPNLQQPIQNFQKSIKDYYSKIRWSPTEQDIINKKEISKNRYKYLPPLKEDLIPSLKSFYVDDSIFGGKVLENGFTYNAKNDRMEFSDQQVEIDTKGKGDFKMMNILMNVANTLDKDIVMTGDCPSNNESGKMPLLDCQIWMEQNEKYPSGQIFYNHYRKPMASKLTIQRDSALPLPQKITIMSQEIFRILRNTHPLTGDVWKKDVSDFAQRMKNSGWDESTRIRVIKQGIIGWMRVLSREHFLGEPRFRHFYYNREARDKTKIDKKNNWFKTSENDDTEAVVMVDATPNSELKTIIDNEIKNTSLKIRVVERPGPKHSFTMLATNSNSRPKCERACLVCETKGGGNCRSKSVVYELLCEACKSGYDGQTGRNALSRGREHVAKSTVNDLKEREKSVIYRHERDSHDGQKMKWNMKVVKSFNKRPLDRKIYESIRIDNRPSELSLNSKHEYAQSGIIRVSFESEITKAKKEKILIKEASKSNQLSGTINELNEQNANAMTSQSKGKIKAMVNIIENNIKQNTPIRNNIKTYFRSKMDEKWPPPTQTPKK